MRTLCRKDINSLAAPPSATNSWFRTLMLQQAALLPTIFPTTPRAHHTALRLRTPLAHLPTIMSRDHLLTPCLPASPSRSVRGLPRALPPERFDATYGLCYGHYAFMRSRLRAVPLCFRRGMPYARFVPRLPTRSIRHRLSITHSLHSSRRGGRADTWHLRQPINGRT